jgi:hypothetical protein
MSTVSFEFAKGPEECVTEEPIEVPAENEDSTEKIVKMVLTFAAGFIFAKMTNRFFIPKKMKDLSIPESASWSDSEINALNTYLLNFNEYAKKNGYVFAVDKRRKAHASFGPIRRCEEGNVTRYWF